MRKNIVIILQKTRFIVYHSLVFKPLSMLILVFSSLSATTHHPSPKVAIIGAGLAGLTTAYRLKQLGFDVNVYEAKNRVGGRVFTVKIGGNPAELGGQNVRDGGKAEHFLALVRELGLDVETKIIRLHLQYFDGNRLIDPSALLKACNFTPETLRKQLDTICQSAKNMCDVLHALFKENEILYKVFSTRLAAYEGVSVEHLSLVCTETLYHMLLGGLAAVHQHIGDDKANMESVVVKGGNGLLTEKLSKLVGHVHLNCPLKSIAKQGSSYLLTFHTQEQVVADILVLAIPCTVYEDIAIEKGIIPHNRLNNIKAVLYGTNAKIIVPMTPPHQKTGGYTNGRMISFFHPSLHALNLYYVGNYGKFTAATIEKTFQEELPLLQRFYSLPHVLTPTVARDESFASYAGPVGHSWPNDPYAKGSYSCIGIGQEKVLTACENWNGEQVKSLFAPINNTLFFAGEHTSILFDVGGTMEAAVESGERTARSIKNSRDFPETFGQGLE